MLLARENPDYGSIWMLRVSELWLLSIRCGQVPQESEDMGVMVTESDTMPCKTTYLPEKKDGRSGPPDLRNP